MPEINFIKRLEAAPKVKTQIHALAPPAASAKALLAFAQAFGVESQRAEQAQDPAKFTYTAGQHIVTLFKASGALRYQDQTRWQVDDGKANFKIGDAEAQKLALDLVRKHKLAPSSDFKLLQVTRLTVGDGSAETKRSTERVIDVGVAFQRTVGGVPVDGPGGKLIVYIDQKGELTGFDRIWRPIQAVQAPVRALQDPKAAAEDLQRYWASHDTGHIDVEDMRFGYFELGYQAAQRVLQPAYIMLLRLVSPESPDGQNPISMRSVHVFPAATNAVGRFMPPPKKLVQQPARKG